MASPNYIDAHVNPRDPVAPDYGCHISITQIVAVSVVTFGIYWVYWMYRTWQQYRDHTLDLAAESDQHHHPAWHGLTQIVPVYGFFRFHAHVRVYKSLMQERGLANSLSPAVLVTLVVVNDVVGWIGIGLDNLPEGPDAAIIVAVSHLISVITLLVSIGVLCRVQSNLNQYWAAMGGLPAQNARFGKGAFLCVVLGVLLWLRLIADFTIW